MNLLRFLNLVGCAICLSGCIDESNFDRKPKRNVEQKAQAEAARREMEALPKAFQNRDLFKKNKSTDAGRPTGTAK